ncbi:hypothetical protein SAMN05216360_102438 [Methylobacterium phyllostachyos]|uniref:Uncharacterized protein n=1 Tax=Methylobacterium phyllostachyos TaxID=582672 RepID=A0A1G9U7T7_9HYPH|nr:hypothetical protein [Methylobacterium phyllostachyos]SDM55928.1 hypothetical protein SAMN05216360_102438 [Methylobacterium phyllostachyos]
MTVTLRADDGTNGTIRLEGDCPVEDAETLASLILGDPGRAVDWTACTRMHTAVYQVLLRLRPVMRGTCRDPFVGRWLTPPRSG